MNSEGSEADGNKPESQCLQSKELHGNTKPTRISGTLKTTSFMIGSLVLGIAFALGQHFFCVYCAGREANHQLEQQWVIRAVTAFAFVAKMLFAISTGIAYIQQCWVALRSRPQSVRRVDAMFSVLSNILQFVDPGLWLRSPLLTFSAVVTWALPLAAVVTPGTITVNSVQQNATSPGLVPQIEYNLLQYASAGCDRDGGCTYGGPTYSLARLAISSATQGQILPINAPQPNASYATSFFGPALSCVSLDSTNLTEIFNQDTSSDDGELQYLSWVPSAKYPSVSVAPVKYGDGFDTVDLSWEDTTLDLLSTQAAKIFILGQTGFPDTTIEFNYTLLECSLKNASYTVNFDFRYPSQTIGVRSRDLLNGVPASDVVPNYMPGYGPDTFSPLSKPSVAYQAVMDAFGRVMVGQTATPYQQGIISTSTLFPMTNLWSEILTQTGDLPTPDPAGNSTFGPGVEELFQNITLSLLSSAQFRANASQSTPVMVTTEQYRQLYVYHPRYLYLAYGLSILCSLICVVLGMLALHRNGSGYSNDFSTVLRTTRAHDFDAFVNTPGAAKGGNPLGTRLASQLIVFDDDVFSHERPPRQGFVGGFVPYNPPGSQGLLLERKNRD